MPDTLTRYPTTRETTVTFRTRDGWYCHVEGETYGPWACEEYARAGEQVEQRRFERRQQKERAAFMAVLADMARV